MAAPAELVRVIRLADGRLDVSRVGPGRGAWLCRSSETCVEAAVRRGGLARAFRASITPEAAEALRTELVRRARMDEYVP